MNEFATAPAPIVERLERPAGQACIYDASRMDRCDLALFDPVSPERPGECSMLGDGRRPVHLVRRGGHDWVLRHYWRGGLMAHVLSDRYLRTGLARSRPLREWRLLCTLHELGLAVPRPVAARVEFQGPFWRGDLITELIPHTRTLFDVIKSEEDSPSTWHSVGRRIAAFHRHGVWHADLNARNILIQRGNNVWLIDWDRGRQNPVWSLSGNLKRLARSLEKWPETRERAREGWTHLLQGYHEERNRHGG
nr:MULTISPECIES: 3-deoxy-D-manno-octulosonic acid kinase [unclassified Thioalkalivibrio]